MAPKPTGLASAITLVFHSYQSIQVSLHWTVASLTHQMITVGPAPTQMILHSL